MKKPSKRGRGGSYLQDKDGNRRLIEGTDQKPDPVQAPKTTPKPTPDTAGGK